MPATTPASAADHSKCIVCGAPNGLHSVVVDGNTAHDTCVDWTVQPFPGASVGDDARRTARRLRALAACLDLAGAAFDRMARSWPRAAVETLRRYHALRAKVRRAAFDATRGW